MKHMDGKRIVVADSASFGRPPNADLLEALRSIARVDIISGLPSCGDPVKLAKALRGPENRPVDGILASVTPQYSDGVVALLPELKVIARHGRGYDNCPLLGAKEAGIPVCNVDGMLEQDSVAQLGLFLLGDLVRGITASHNSLTNGGPWSDRKEFHGPELNHHRTVGVIGTGIVGSKLVGIFDFLGCKVLATDPVVPNEQIVAMGAQAVDHETLYANSDFIVVSASNLPEFPLKLDEAAVRAMKDGVYIVNIARGVFLDEGAIRDGLDQAKIAGLAVDVYPTEPPSPVSPLLNSGHPRVITTQHLGGYGSDSKRGMGETCVKVLTEAFRTDVEHPWANFPWERVVNGVTPDTVCWGNVLAEK